MTVLRVLSFVFIAAAAAALGRDIYLSLDTGRLASSSLGAVWVSLHAPSLTLFQAVVERYVSPALWDPLVVSILLSPAWLDLIGLAAIILLPTWLFRSRDRNRR